MIDTRDNHVTRFVFCHLANDPRKWSLYYLFFVVVTRYPEKTTQIYIEVRFIYRSL